MLKFIKDNEFQCHSPDGRSVDLKHNQLSYRDGDHVMTIESMLLGERVVISRGSVRRWHRPYDGEDVTAETKAKILEDVAEAMSALGARVDWVS